MLEPTLPASKESSCEFLLHRLPLSCFRPVSSKTDSSAFPFIFPLHSFVAECGQSVPIVFYPRALTDTKAKVGCFS